MIARQIKNINFYTMEIVLKVVHKFQELKMLIPYVKKSIIIKYT